MSEMSVEVQVGSVVVDAASVAHASRHKHGGLDPIATETPGAYAIPKADATGKLAAGFIPMGLISGGISTLDDLSDGSSYKRILAAVATALNADTYTASDADKVSAFGIGVYKTIASGSLNDVILPGLYSFYVGDVTEDPSSAGSTGIYGLLVFGLSATNIVQIAFETGNYIWFRSGNSSTSTWGAWKQVWNGASDGNGGRPPAPKPKAYSSGTTIGEITATGLAAGATWTNPGGTWSYWAIDFDNSTNAYGGSGGSGVTTGNLTALAGYKRYFILWRIA